MIDDDIDRMAITYAQTSIFSYDDIKGAFLGLANNPDSYPEDVAAAIEYADLIFQMAATQPASLSAQRSSLSKALRNFEALFHDR